MNFIQQCRGGNRLRVVLKQSQGPQLASERSRISSQVCLNPEACSFGFIGFARLWESLQLPLAAFIATQDPERSLV